MVEIRNEHELVSWLRKSDLTVSDVIFRFGLRVLPAWGRHVLPIRSLVRDWRQSCVLPAFAFYFARGLFWEGNRESYEEFFRKAPSFRDFAPSLANFQFYMASVLKEIYPWKINNKIELMKLVRFSARSKGNLYSVEESQYFWRALSLDATALESGVDLSSQPLWLDDTPRWAQYGWEVLASDLTRGMPYWKTLVRWYEDRLRGDEWAASQGRPAIPELEIARASLPDSYWKKGGKAVNLAIAELEDFFWNNVPLKDPALRGLVNGIGFIADDEEGEIIEDDTSAPLDALPPIEALPEQSSSGMTFGRLAGGPIALAPPSGNDVLLATPDRIEDYLELRRKAMDVLAEGANRLGRLGKPLHFFCELPADLTAVRAKVLWGHINALRIVLKGHDEAVRAQAAGLDPDDRRLDGFAADGLQDIVETANVFFAGDPNLIELDAVRRGPREQADAKAEIAQIEKPLKEALNNGVITEGATGVIVEEQITIALAAPDTLDGRQATELGAKTVRNFVAMLLRALRSELPVGWKGARDGAYREIGKYVLISGAGAVSPFAQDALHFIGVHTSELLGYVHTAFQNADLETLIRILSQLN